MKKTFKHRDLEGIGECSQYDKEIVVDVDDVNPQPVYCEECGRELVEISSGDEKDPNPPRKKWWIWIVAAIVGIVLLFIFVRGRNPDKITINAQSEDETMGMVNGGGSFDEGDTVTLSANAKDGYCFVNWRDSIGNNVSRDSVWKFCVECDALFIAHFTKKVDPVQQYNECGDTIIINGADTNIIKNTRIDTTYNENGDTIVKRGCEVLEIRKSKKIEPPKPSEKSNVIHYSIGDYVGERKNGIPEGDGTFYYRCRVQIAKHDTGKPPHYAEAGDYFVGSWGNGDIVSGALYDKDRNLKEYIRAPKRFNPYDLHKEKCQ